MTDAELRLFLDAMKDMLHDQRAFAEAAKTLHREANLRAGKAAPGRPSGPRQRTKVTSKQIKQIVADHKAGKTVCQIAAEQQLSRQHVYTILHQYSS